MRIWLKRWVSRALGKSGAPVVAVFLSGERSRAQAMARAMRELLPDRPHVIIGEAPADWTAYTYAEEVIEVDPRRPLACWLDLRRRLGRRWIALAPFLWTEGGPLRWMPWLLAPRKLLAFHADLERHHLRLRCPIASWRFLRGERVGDIFRPTALGGFWRRAESPGPARAFAGRPASQQKRVAVVTPYLPFPLAHGGAIRIFNLLREAARDTDIYLFAFAEPDDEWHIGPLLAFCAQVVLVPTPRWEPAALLRVLPRGVAKFRSPAMRAAIETAVEQAKIPIVQIEFTQLAHLGSELRGLSARKVLVEHDVTFDLHRQQRLRARGAARLGAWIEEGRWRRYELGHAGAFDHVIAMSPEDRQRLVGAGLDAGRISVVENGVDLDRCQPAARSPLPSPELLFIGSFRHFPNVLGFRFLLDTVWPALSRARPDVRLTVVAGSDPRYYWRIHTDSELPRLPPEVELLEFVEDVRPLYSRAAVVAVPLVVSAGTNIKVLEALAMGRAVVSTSVGAAGLGLTSGENVLLADSAEGFAAAVLNLLADEGGREQLAARGRALVEERFGWAALAAKQAAVWGGLSGAR